MYISRSFTSPAGVSFVCNSYRISMDSKLVYYYSYQLCLLPLRSRKSRTRGCEAGITLDLIFLDIRARKEILLLHIRRPAALVLLEVLHHARLLLRLVLPPVHLRLVQHIQLSFLALNLLKHRVDATRRVQPGFLELLRLLRLGIYGPRDFNLLPRKVAHLGDDQLAVRLRYDLAPASLNLCAFIILSLLLATRCRLNGANVAICD
mmetsp:Transcript_7953/g.13785  ORF Transcript_7953/g.13785 Transcript_7953/m.13785 type:complete len:206 (-) Transcript_7953:253-870(-)